MKYYYHERTAAILEHYLMMDNDDNPVDLYVNQGPYGWIHIRDKLRMPSKAKLKAIEISEKEFKAGVFTAML